MDVKLFKDYAEFVNYIKVNNTKTNGVSQEFLNFHEISLNDYIEKLGCQLPSVATHLLRQTGQFRRRG